MRVDDVNAFYWQEPYLSISGRGYDRVAVRRGDTALESVRVVPTRGAHVLSGISDPAVQLRSSDAHQAASRIQPEEMVAVLQHPVEVIARQSVRAGKPVGMAAPDKIESAASRRPNRAVIIEL